jgi:hypothetical protein
MVVVLNVQPNQSTASGLKVEVRFEIFDPSVPNPRAVFDYDDLVEFEYVFSFSKQRPPPDPDKYDLGQKRSYLHFVTQRILFSIQRMDTTPHRLPQAPPRQPSPLYA